MGLNRKPRPILGLIVCVISLLSALPCNAQLLQTWRLTPIKAAPPIPAIPVIVTNNPLPVSVTNPVTVGNSLTIGSPVTVGNAATNPVLTRDIDNPANEPYEFILCASAGSSLSTCFPRSETFANTTPFSGKTIKRFVAEYVSGKCDTTADTHIVDVDVIRQFSDGLVGMGHHFVPVSVAGSPGFGEYVFAQQTRLYRNPGETMAPGVSYWGDGNYSCLFSVSGYYVTQ